MFKEKKYILKFVLLFVLLSSRYNMINIILLLVLFSKWIYDPYVIMIPNNFNVLHLTSRVGVLQSIDKYCYVVHRGTSSISDVIHDIKSELYQYCTKDNINREFYKSFTFISNITLLLQNNCKQTFFTGHSLGGITSRISAFYNAHHVNGVITFGEPRGCCNEKTIMDKKSLRIVNGKDPIPTLPYGHNLNHCSSNTLDITTKKWNLNDTHFPHFVSSNMIYDVFMYHRINAYVKSVESMEQYIAYLD